MIAAIREASDTQRAVAFGSLVDLARLQVGTPSVEICDACNTINMGSARLCKCCSHKLPASYAPTKDTTKGERGTPLPWHSLAMVNRASVMDFVAFAVVINLLVLITASIPIT